MISIIRCSAWLMIISFIVDLNLQSWEEKQFLSSAQADYFFFKWNLVSFCFMTITATSMCYQLIRDFIESKINPFDYLEKYLSAQQDIENDDEDIEELIDTNIKLETEEKRRERVKRALELHKPDADMFEKKMQQELIDAQLSPSREIELREVPAWERNLRESGNLPELLPLAEIPAAQQSYHANALLDKLDQLVADSQKCEQKKGEQDQAGSAREMQKKRVQFANLDWKQIVTDGEMQEKRNTNSVMQAIHEFALRKAEIQKEGKEPANNDNNSSNKVEWPYREMNPISSIPFLRLPVEKNVNDKDEEKLETADECSII